MLTEDPRRLDRTLTVSQLTARLSGLLDSDPGLQGLQVRGEITNWLRHRSGHCYFALKDGRAQVRCVMYGGDARWLRFNPGDGVQVMVHGSVVLFEPKGELQLRVRRMQPDGLGALYVALEKLKARLAQEGLFDPGRKRALPRFPRVIGLVTSSDGAVLHDVQTTLARRNPAVQVLLAPSAVQGPGADKALVRALRRLQAHPAVECIILGRGGGSFEDLMAFNSEVVVRAVAECRVPVISAVGHETDQTLCDLAADRRAPTPTAAAEMVAPARDDLLHGLDTCRQRMLRALTRRLRLERERLERLRASPSLRFPTRRVEREAQALDGLADGLRRAMARRLRAEADGLEALRRLARTHHPRARVERMAQALGSLQEALRRAMAGRLRAEGDRLEAARQRVRLHHPAARVLRHRRDLEDLRRRLVPAGARIAGPRKDRLEGLRTNLLRAVAAFAARRRERLESLRGRLAALSPLNVLDRGYALVQDEAGRVVAEVAQAHPGERVSVRLRDGSFRATVEEKRT